MKTQQITSVSKSQCLPQQTEGCRCTGFTDDRVIIAHSHRE